MPLEVAAPHYFLMTFPDAIPDLLALLLRRLRARPDHSWAHGERETVMRSALQQLADLAADAHNAPQRLVPDVGRAALADQLAVLVRAALDAGVAQSDVAVMLRDVAQALAVEP